MYKKQYPLLDRKRVSETILDRYENRVPIILEAGDRRLVQAGTVNYQRQIMMRDTRIQDLIVSLKQKLGDQFRPTDSLFIYADNRILNGFTTIGKAYDQYRDEDGFLYLTYTTQETFG